MNYDYFISMVKHHETDRIRAFSGKQQTNPEQVPSAFALLTSEIISILDSNLDSICDTDQSLVVFGLQPASGMMASNQPLELGRFIEGFEPDYHFCCTLDFFKVPMNKVKCSNTWVSTESIIIDFTSGELMDVDRFLSKLHFLPLEGKLYGKISDAALDIAWKIIKIKQAKTHSKSILYDSLLMEEPVADVA